MAPHNGGSGLTHIIGRQGVRKGISKPFYGPCVVGAAERGVTGADRATAHANQGQHHYL